MDPRREDDLDQLNSFLRGERSAVETYNQAIAKIEDDALRDRLRSLRQSHEVRVAKLTSKIRELGGEPSDRSGLWGSFAKLVEGGAALFGSKAAIAALEEGEDHGCADYERDRAKVSPGVRDFISSTLLPEQNRTHAELRGLRSTYSSP